MQIYHCINIVVTFKRGRRFFDIWKCLEKGLKFFFGSEQGMGSSNGVVQESGEYFIAYRNYIKYHLK